MAEKGLESLNCPLCLDVYEEATLLACGHTFCRTCLVQYHTSRQDDNDNESISCPLCRRETQLGSGGVADLPSNDTVNLQLEEYNSTCNPLQKLFEQDKGFPRCSECQANGKGREGMGDADVAVVFCYDCGHFLCGPCRAAHERLVITFQDHRVVPVKDVLTGKVQTTTNADKCPLHPAENRALYCVKCRVFICLTCAIVKHNVRDHEIRVGNGLEREISDNTDDVTSRCETMRKVLGRHIRNTEQERRDVNAAAEALQLSIDDAFDVKQRELEEQKQSVKTEVRILQARCNEKLDTITTVARKRSVQLSTSVKFLARRSRGGLEGDCRTSYDQLCCDINELIQRCETWSTEAENHSGEVRKVAETVKFERNQNSDLRIGNLAGMPGKGDMVKEIVLPGDNPMNGLCVASPDSVLIASCRSPCVYKVTLDGKLNTFCSLASSEQMCDVTVLSTGTATVLTKTRLRQFDTSGAHSIMSTEFKLNLPSSRNFKMLECDRDDNIFVSCWNEKLIHVFKPTGGEPERTLNIRATPQQVHTTRCGRIVVQSPNGVIILEASGKEVTTIRSKAGYYLYPAVDQDDNLYIASIQHSQGIVSLERYNLNGEHVRTIVKDFKIKIAKRQWYYLKCLSRNDMVLCTPGMMYVFKNMFILI